MRLAPGQRRSTGGLTRVALRAVLCALPLAAAAVPACRPAPAAAQTRDVGRQTRTPQSARSQTQTPQSARPATLADYRERVGRAAEALEERAFFHESQADAEVVLREEPEDASQLLPAKERVEWGGDFVEVDNSWLRAALDEVEGVSGQGEDEQRAALLRATAGRLRALEARLAEVEGGAAGAFDADAERGRLNAILRAPEFNREARQPGGALQRLVREFFEFLLDLLPDGPRLAPGASPQVSLATQLVVLGLCLAVIAYVARRLWRRRGQGAGSLKLKRGARVVLGERLEADQTAADLLEEAERLARAGELRGAIRKAYVALLCELGDRGVVRLERHKTNRDYLGAVRRAARPGLYAEMLPLTFDFEVHWYGLRDASDADWQSFVARCRKILSSQ